MKKIEWLDQAPWATWFAGAILLIVAGVGAAITIIEPKTLSFAEYSKDLANLAVGVGLVAVGRGVTSAGKQIGKEGGDPVAPGAMAAPGGAAPGGPAGG
jgi:hypothetical protein